MLKGCVDVYCGQLALATFTLAVHPDKKWQMFIWYNRNSGLAKVRHLLFMEGQLISSLPSTYNFHEGFFLALPFFDTHATRQGVPLLPNPESGSV